MLTQCKLILVALIISSLAPIGSADSSTQHRHYRGRPIARDIQAPPSRNAIPAMTPNFGVPDCSPIGKVLKQYGKMPKTPGEWISALKNFGPVVVVPVPFSQAPKPSDHKDYRIVLAVDNPRETLGKESFGGRLYVGLARNKDRSWSAEILSDTSRNDKILFGEVDNLSKQSVVDHSNEVRSKCIQCHKNEAGIFPEAPWSTTRNSFPAEYALVQQLFKEYPEEYKKEIEVLNGLIKKFSDPKMNQEPNEFKGTPFYFAVLTNPILKNATIRLDGEDLGIRLFTSNVAGSGIVQRFDSLVGSGRRRVQMQQFSNQMDPAIRKDLLHAQLLLAVQSGAYQTLDLAGAFSKRINILRTNHEKFFELAKKIPALKVNHQLRNFDPITGELDGNRHAPHDLDPLTGKNRGLVQEHIRKRQLGEYVLPPEGNPADLKSRFGIDRRDIELELGLWSSYVSSSLEESTIGGVEDRNTVGPCVPMITRDEEIFLSKKWAQIAASAGLSKANTYEVYRAFSEVVKEEMNSGQPYYNMERLKKARENYQELLAKYQPQRKALEEKLLKIFESPTLKALESLGRMPTREEFMYAYLAALGVEDPESAKLAEVYKKLICDDKAETTKPVEASLKGPPGNCLQCHGPGSDLEFRKGDKDFDPSSADKWGKWFENTVKNGSLAPFVIKKFERTYDRITRPNEEAGAMPPLPKGLSSEQVEQINKKKTKTAFELKQLAEKLKRTYKVNFNLPE